MSRNLPSGISIRHDQVDDEGMAVYDNMGEVFQVSDWRTAPSRQVPSEPGTLMKARYDKKGRFLGFIEGGKMYTPLPLRRGVNNPHRITDLVYKTKVDIIYFKEHQEYADNLEPGLLDRLEEPYKAYTAVRKETIDKLNSINEPVPGWLRNEPTIEVLRILAEAGRRPDMKAWAAAIFLTNKAFTDELEDTAPEVLEYLQKTAGDEGTEMNKAADMITGTTGSTGSTGQEEPEAPAVPEGPVSLPEPAAPEGTGTPDDQSSRLDRLERNLEDLTGLIKNMVVPQTRDQRMPGPDGAPGSTGPAGTPRPLDIGVPGIFEPAGGVEGTEGWAKAEDQELPRKEEEKPPPGVYREGELIFTLGPDNVTEGNMDFSGLYPRLIVSCPKGAGVALKQGSGVLFTDGETRGISEVSEPLGAGDREYVILDLDN